MNDSSNMYKCLYCQFASDWDFSIKDHIHLHELQIINEQIDCCHEINKLNCFQCLFQTHLSIKLHQHQNTKHKQEPNQVETEINLSRKSRNSDRLFDCPHCPYRARQNYNLKVHISKIHISSDQIKFYTCPHCPAFQTKWKSCLKMHTTALHAPEDEGRWFECTVEGCTFKTKWRSNLGSHIRGKHTENPKYTYFQCSQCNFATKRKSNLRNHVLFRHTSDNAIQWFLCTECAYKAKSRKYLKEHIAAHHRPQDDTKVDCPHCPFKTKNDRYLKSHIRNLHTENIVKKPKVKRARPKILLSCTVETCDFTTYWRDNLKFHILRKHSSADIGEWVQCPHCDKYRCRRARDLDKHVLLKHTPDDQVKWFQCTICPYKAKIKTSLNRHLKAVHKIENTNIINL